MRRRLSSVLAGDDGRILHWCPACEALHVTRLRDGVAWDGDAEHPSVSREQIVVGYRITLDRSKWDAWHKANPYLRLPGIKVRCHSILRGGTIDFLPRSTHEMVGRSVPMVAIPDRMWT